MQFKDAKKEGTIEFDEIKDCGMGRRARFTLTLTNPVKIEGCFERSDIQWDMKTNRAVGLRTYNKEIVQAFGQKWGSCICISMPEEVLKFIIQKDDEVKEIVKQDKINQDFEYKLYDFDTYGIYNGISEFHIEELVRDVKKQLNADVFLFSDDIKTILNRDQELKQIAVDSYKPYPENDNWNEETKRLYHENVANKSAAGVGIIPNDVMREKIAEIIAAEVEKENKSKVEYDCKIAELLIKAKETGEPQLIAQCTEPCNNPNEECSTDICSYWAMPDGSTEETRCHTW